MRTHHLSRVAMLAAFAVAPALAQVEEAWIDRLDGPASLNDYADALAIGADGSVYVAGSVFEHVHQNRFAPRFMTIRYAADGTRLWTRTYAGTFASGAAAAGHIAIDGDGNVLVAGSTNEGDDWAVLKYDPAGNELWRRVYEANSTFLTEPRDMAVDAAGDVYLAGYVGDGSNPDAGVLVKITSDGVQAWARRYYGPAFEGAFFAAIAVDDAGGVYAAGAAVVPDLASELLVVRYDSAGNEAWFATDGSTGRFTHDRAADVLVDGNGDLVVVGLFGANSAAGLDLVAAKYDAAGTQLWRRLYDGPDRYDDSAAEVAVDGEDNIVVVGSSAVSFDYSDALTLKYDPSGNLLWERRVAGEELFADRATGVAIDGQDNIYVAGTYDPIGGSRFFTVRYDPDGTEAWFMDYAGPLGGGSRATDVAVGTDGSVAVTGDSPDQGTEFDIATIRYEQPPADTPGDANGDGVVNFEDLLAILGAWGPCEGECPEDQSGDGVVGFADVLIVLSNWT